MAKLKIKTPQKTHDVNGEVSMTLQKVINPETNIEELVCTGLLSTEPYFEEIEEIITERFTISQVEIVREDFGTNEREIVYSFVGKD